MTCTLQGPNSCWSRCSTSSCAADCCARRSTVQFDKKFNTVSNAADRRSEKEKGQKLGAVAT